MLSLRSLMTSLILSMGYFSVSLFLLLPQSAFAGTVKGMINSGPSENRVDIIILGDGYRAAEMSKFAADAQKAASHFVGTYPFSRYRRHFNVKRIETPSRQSGATKPGSPKNTFYGAYYDCAGIRRLICVDYAKVYAELQASLTADQYDIILLLVNDTEYGGSGGAVAVSSTHGSATEIAMHEIGHSFGGLADEYDYGGCRSSSFGEPNVTDKTARSQIPWKHWIPASTPLPTPQGRDGVGLFEGAYYCPNGWYRPTNDSKMRSLERPFEQVNSEQLILQIHEFASLIDKAVPRKSLVQIKRGRSVQFKIKPTPTSTPLDIVWRLDGKRVGVKNKITIKFHNLKGRKKRLSVLVRNREKAVRVDKEKRLIEKASWKLVPDFQ